MDPIEKAKGAMGSLEHAAMSLPGIGGYREKELRRDADRKVRDGLVHELEVRRNRISALQEDLLSAGGLAWMDDMERVVGRLQLVIDRIRTAAYGYSGFFDLEKVKEQELDQLMAYDRSLFDDLPKLDQSIDDLEKAVRANDNIQAALQAVAALLSDLNDKFGRRLDAIREAAA